MLYNRIKRSMYRCFGFNGWTHKESSYKLDS